MTDWLTLRAASLEISSRYARARVDAVDLDEAVLSLGLRGTGAPTRLMIDLRPQMPPIYLAAPSAQGKGSVPQRLQVLRRSLLGARLEGAFAPFGERVLVLCLLGRDRFGDPLALQVAAEYFGTRPDIVATEAGVVLFALHGRRAEPGDRLRLPRLSPPPRRRLPSAPGVTPAEAARRAARGDFQPSLLSDSSPPRIDLFGGGNASVLAILSEIARITGGDLRLERLRRSLSERLERRLGARDRTLVEKEREYRESAGAEELLRKGEALKLALREVPSGSSEVRLMDPSGSGGQILVPLDPEQSPEANMEALFRRYRKLRVRHGRLGGEIESLREEVRLLGDLLAELRSLDDIGALETFSARNADLFTERPAGGSVSGKGAQGPLRFRTEGGHELLVGRSAQENERLTRSARPSDVWFHAKDRQGAHCILRPLPDRPIGAPDRLEAALIAAFYSKGRQGSHVPVDYTFIRHLRKARGMGPGHFLYDHHETLFVTPDTASVDRIRNRRGSSRS